MYKSDVHICTMTSGQRLPFYALWRLCDMLPSYSLVIITAYCVVPNSWINMRISKAYMQDK